MESSTRHTVDTLPPHHEEGETRHRPDLDLPCRTVQWHLSEKPWRQAGLGDPLFQSFQERPCPSGEGHRKDLCYDLKMDARQGRHMFNLIH